MKNNINQFLHLTFLSACLTFGGGLAQVVNAQDFKSLDKSSSLLSAQKDEYKNKSFIATNSLLDSTNLAQNKDRQLEEQKRFVFSKSAKNPSTSHSRAVSSLSQQSLVGYYKLKDHLQEKGGDKEGEQLRANLFNSLSELTHELKRSEYSKDSLDVTARMSMVVLADVLQEQKEMDYTLLNSLASSQSYSLNFAISEYLQEYKAQSFTAPQRVNKVSSLKPYK